VFHSLKYGGVSMKNKFFNALSLALIVAMLVTSLALAENVKNDVDAGGNDTFTAGGSTTINYWIQNTGSSVCEAADGTSVTIAINVPAGVTATPSSLVFSACNTGSEGSPTNTQSVVFSSSASGDFPITVSASDSADPSGYNTSPASFTLHVNAAPPPSDITPPSIDCTVPDQTIWYGTDVTVNCTASDSGSGLDNPADASFSLSTNVSAGTETASASTDSRTVYDKAGNSATAGPYSFMVDKKAPAVACNLPAPAFLLNQSPAFVTATATDGGSGPATQQASAGADTSSIGSKSVQVSASDNVGNSGSAFCSYSVTYNFSGFFQPVDNLPAMNSAKAGQAIPLKWRLTDANGAPVLNLTSVNVSVASLSCSLGTTIDQLEEYAAGSSGLQNLGDGYYQFNWKMPTSYANSCKTMNLNLGDGVPHTAQFQFKK
jgi:hypothetical protein